MSLRQALDWRENREREVEEMTGRETRRGMMEGFMQQSNERQPGISQAPHLRFEPAVHIPR